MRSLIVIVAVLLSTNSVAQQCSTTTIITPSGQVQTCMRCVYPDGSVVLNCV